MQIKRASVCLVIAVILSSLSHYNPVQANQNIYISQSVWRQFSDKTGKFAILFPGTPDELKQTVKTPVGVLELKMFVVERQQESVSYGVGYTEYPSNYAKNLNQNNILDQVLDHAKNGALKNEKGTLVSQRKISLGKYAGREIKYSKSGNKITVHRIYLVNRRLYQVIVETTKEKEKFLTRSMSGFLDSFQIYE